VRVYYLGFWANPAAVTDQLAVYNDLRIHERPEQVKSGFLWHWDRRCCASKLTGVLHRYHAAVRALNIFLNQIRKFFFVKQKKELYHFDPNEPQPYVGIRLLG
jgi:hypothetical protein